MKLEKDYYGVNMFPDKKNCALAFQTGKGQNDALLQRFVLGRHIRKKNAIYCSYDEAKSKIDFKRPEGWPPSKRVPTPPNSYLYWSHLEDPKWDSSKVNSYWFWGFMRNTKRIVEVAEQKKIDWFFIDHAYLYHQRHSMFKKHGDTGNCLFRVCKNNYVIEKITDTKDNRLNELKVKFAKDDELEIKPWNKNGKHIIVIPPSRWLRKH